MYFEVCASNKKRLDLSFQPQNPYIKKIYADGRKSAGILLKVKVKKTSREVVSTAVLGRVKNTYRFESLCDFQYLPVAVDEDNSKPRCILDDIIPSGLDNFDFLKRPVPSFLLPPHFVRNEKSMNYYYTDIHHIKREERVMPCARSAFNMVDDFPTEPDPYYLEKKNQRFKVYPQVEDEFQRIKKLFEEKPIWPLNEVKYHTKIKVMSLKMLLPCVAVYLSDGPWRAMWVRFGYDPRKDPNARKYQTLDFRVRSTGGINVMVTNKCKKRRDGKYTTDFKRSFEQDSDVANDTIVNESSVYFRPGSVPAQRQIFYQFMNVELPEVQTLLATAAAECDPRRGWLPPGVVEKCRDHMFHHVTQALIANTAHPKLKEHLSDDESGDQNSDDAVGDIPMTENTQA